MPQCQFLFSAVFVFQKSYSGNILGIGRKSTEVPISPTRTRSPKGRRSRATRWPHKGSARPRVGPRRTLVWAPWVPPAATLSSTYSPRRENPKYPSHYPRKVPETPPPSTLAREGPEPLPGTLPERGIITGGLYIAMPASGVMRE